MPTATSFTALGRGNGFPSCLNKTDVSDFDYWTTLSGFNKDSGGSPTDQQITESYILAMKLFWNVFEATAPSTASRTDTGASVEGTSVDTSSSTFDKPKDRVCANSSIVVSDYNQNANTEALIKLIVTPPRRMYNGATTQEDNFIGYGAYTTVLTYGWTSTNAYSEVSISGTGSNQSNTSNQSFDFGYITLGDMHFVATCSARVLPYDSSNGRTLTVDASVPSASATLTTEDSTYEAESEITELDFYTY